MISTLKKEQVQALLKNPLIKLVDLSEGFDEVSQREALRHYLTTNRLDRPNLLYRGFEGDHLEDMLKTGKECTGKLWCFTTEEMFEEEPDQDALTHAIGKEIPAIAIYDARKFYRRDVSHVCTLKKGASRKGALLTVLLLVF